MHTFILPEFVKGHLLKKLRVSFDFSLMLHSLLADDDFTCEYGQM